jgi:hypothetical protein
MAEDPQHIPNAYATYTDANENKINIGIKGQEITLSVDDCIKFNTINHRNPADITYITAQITGFSTMVTRPFKIFYKPWDDAEGKWRRPLRNDFIGLEHPYTNENGFGDWTSINKLPVCPGQMGGSRRRNRKSTKRVRRNRRYSRRK